MLEGKIAGCSGQDRAHQTEVAVKQPAATHEDGSLYSQPCPLHPHTLDALIVGGGFAGLRALLALARMPVDVALIDEAITILSSLCFIRWLWRSCLRPSRTTHPRDPVHMQNVEVFRDEVVRFDRDRQGVLLKTGPEIAILA